MVMRVIPAFVGLLVLAVSFAESQEAKGERIVIHGDSKGIVYLNEALFVNEEGRVVGRCRQKRRVALRSRLSTGVLPV